MLKSSALDKNFSSLEDHLENLLFLEEELKLQTSVEEKIKTLEAIPFVASFLKKSGQVLAWLEAQSLEKRWIVLLLIAMGQGEHVLSIPPDLCEFTSSLDELATALLTVEEFYSEVGGLIGYQKQVLKILKGGFENEKDFSISFHRPDGIDIREESKEVHRAIYEGIKRLPELAEIYPVGGAADRLKLRDPSTDDARPAAGLTFSGKLLLERLIIDLQAREYLYYKLFSCQICTPLALMTSDEKNNHEHILKILEKNNWFARKKDAFFLFSQPLVPAMDRTGKWCLQAPLKLLLKPGGHGVLWRLAKDRGIFSSLYKLGRSKALVRQINNPIAGVDYGLLAFLGFGFLYQKSFGFASCSRPLYANEGMNVLIKKQLNSTTHTVLTNVEYCDLKKFKALDVPEKEGEYTSKFPANTNILFADLVEVEKALENCFLPGMVVNFRKALCDKGEEEVIRLESTMQNIADHFETEGSSCELKTYLTFNHRQKTIAPLKREYMIGSSLAETPEGCFLDMQENAKDLLLRCGFEFSDCFFTYHPALGPLYSIIAQKMRRGKLWKGAELTLEIAELDIEELECQGSLQIRASSIMGHRDENLLTYSEECGKCTLRRVTVKNQGIDFSHPNIFWKEEVQRHASCQIFIEGNGEFFAEDVILEKDLSITVQPNEKVTATMKEGKLFLKREHLSHPSWHWEYLADAEQIILRRNDE